MADSVTVQTLHDGKRNAVIKLTNISDGTGESAVVKADPALLSGQPSALILDRIWWATNGMGFDLLWQAASSVLAWHCSPDMVDDLDLTEVGGIPNNAGGGKTGRLLLTTTGHSSGDRYSAVLWLRKVY